MQPNVIQDIYDTQRSGVVRFLGGRMLRENTSSLSRKARIVDPKTGHLIIHLHIVDIIFTKSVYFQMTMIVSFWTTLVIVSIHGAQGKKQFLVREDKLNTVFLNSYINSTPWTIYIDELLFRLGDIRSIGSVLNHLLSTTVSAEQWCTIPASYAGLYNHSSGNSMETIRYNISEWLPCGVHVIQKYISSTTREASINIHVNQLLHINITFIEMHIDTIALNTDNDFLLPLMRQCNVIKKNIPV